MRVLYITHYGMLEPLGRTQILPYLTGLSRCGYQIEVISFEKLALFSDRVLVQQQLEAMEIAGVGWHPRPYRRGSSVPALLSDVVRTACEIIRRDRSAGIDLLHVRTHVPYLAAWPAAILGDIPILFDFRGFLAEEYADAGIWQAGSWKFRATKALEKRMARAASAVIVLTHPAAEYFVARYGAERDKLFIIPCCVDLERFRPKPWNPESALGRPLSVVYSGSTTGRYRLTEMLSFFELIRRARPGSRFTVLASDDPQKAAAEVRQMGFSDTEVRVFTLRPEAMPDELASHDLGIILIGGSLALSAASPTKIAEYLACGLPVLAEERIGDLREVLHQSRVGCLIDSGRPATWNQALAAALELCDDPEISTRAAETAAQRYSLAGGIRMYEKAYRFAAGRSSA
jgi:glycosyltransferase involved in cell wall biosynthesis